MESSRTSEGRHVKVVESSVDRRLRLLESSLEHEHVSKMRWRKGFAIVSVVALLGISVAAVALTINSRTYQGVSGEVVDYDGALFLLFPDGILVNPLGAQSANGPSAGSAVEMPLVLGSAYTDLGALNWTYVAVVSEATDGVVPIDSTYVAELFVNSTSKGKIYFEQTVDSLGVEPLTLHWDIGADLPLSAQSYTVRIETA